MNVSDLVFKATEICLTAVQKAEAKAMAAVQGVGDAISKRVDTIADSVKSQGSALGDLQKDVVKLDASLTNCVDNMLKAAGTAAEEREQRINDVVTAAQAETQKAHDEFTKSVGDQVAGIVAQLETYAETREEAFAKAENQLATDLDLQEKSILEKVGAKLEDAFMSAAKATGKLVTEQADRITKFMADFEVFKKDIGAADELIQETLGAHDDKLAELAKTAQTLTKALEAIAPLEAALQAVIARCDKADQALDALVALVEAKATTQAVEDLSKRLDDMQPDPRELAMILAKDHGKALAQHVIAEKGEKGDKGDRGEPGFSLDDLTFVQTDPRGGEFRLGSGDETKSFPVKVPGFVHKGVYQHDADYVTGDSVSFGGSQFHAMQDDPPGKPGEEKSGWALSVKRGRDGKDLRPVPPVTPKGYKL